ACALIVGGYVCTMTVLGGSGRILADDTVVLTAASAIAVFMTGARERARRHVFAQGFALEQAHREARASGERYRSLVETAGDAIIVLSPTGAIVEWNREAERLLGWPREGTIRRKAPGLGGTPQDRGSPATS